MGVRPKESEMRPAKSKVTVTAAKYVNMVFEISVVVRPMVV